MKLSEYLRPECVLAKAALESKDAALRTVARLAKKCSVLSQIDEEQIFLALKEREVIGSTGFGHGVAVPHCRLSRVYELVVGIVTVPDGVEFESVDGEKVKVIVFVVGPERETNEHIRILSAISHVLRAPDAVQNIMAQEAPQSVSETFLSYTADKVSVSAGAERNLFYVLVQDEDILRDLLEVFTGIASTSVSVLQSESANSYLAKVSDLWSDNPQFTKVILAIVEKPFTNEIIRRIESVVGPLAHRTDVIVTVQNVFFAAGSLAV